MGELKKLTVRDSENISKAILELVLKYPDYPADFKASHKTIKWNSIDTTKSIGLFPMQGAVYTRQYISGSYIAQFPFRVVLKASPTSNAEVLSNQTLLEDLAKWLEECDVEFSDSDLTLESIERTSIVYGTNAEPTNSEFTVTLLAKYSYRR